MSPKLGQIVKHFAPSCFAAVTGTGASALGAAFLGLAFSPLSTLSMIPHGRVTLVRSVRGAMDGSLFQPH